MTFFGARGGFDINGKHNGKAMLKEDHQLVKGHPRYNDGVASVLEQHANGAGNFDHLSDEEAAWILLEIAEKTHRDIDRAIKVGGGLTGLGKQFSAGRLATHYDAHATCHGSFFTIADLGSTSATTPQRML